MGQINGGISPVEVTAGEVEPLYRHAQPAPVVPEEATPDSIEILASAGVVTALYSSGMKTSEMRPLILERLPRRHARSRPSVTRQ